jgi:hypothetical protein
MGFNSGLKRLNPHDRNTRTPYVRLLTFLQHVVVVPFDHCEGEASSIAHFSIYLLVFSTWYWWNGTKGTCRKGSAFLWVVTQRIIPRCVTTQENTVHVYFAAEVWNRECFRKVNQWSTEFECCVCVDLNRSCIVTTTLHSEKFFTSRIVIFHCLQ